MFDKRKLQAVMLLKGKKVEDISKVLGVNESTIYRKLNNDGDFSRSEIEKLVDYLEIDNPVDIFFS